MRMMALADCPIKRLWCLFLFPCINTSVDMRVKYPRFIGRIRVPARLANKLAYVCQGHVGNVKLLAQGGPARLYSITVYGIMRHEPYSVDLDLGRHGAKDVEFVSYFGYGSLSRFVTYSYPMQTALSSHAHQLQHLMRKETKSWSWTLDDVSPQYPRQFLEEVNPHNSIAACHYGEQL